MGINMNVKFLQYTPNVNTSQKVKQPLEIGYDIINSIIVLIMILSYFKASKRQELLIMKKNDT